jgi:pentatricopeptide repeat protein
VIAAYGRERKWDEMEATREKMHASGLLPQMFTYESIVRFV